MAYGDMGLENAQTFDLVKEAVGLLDVDVLLHIGIGPKLKSHLKAGLVQNLALAGPHSFLNRRRRLLL